MFMRSERLFLRPGWPEDWRDVLEGIGDEQVVRNLALAPWPFAEADARAFVARPQQHGMPHFLITLPTDSGARVIGSIGLGASGRRGEMGYWIARPFWGQGFASEAVCAVLEVAQTLGFGALSAFHFVDNPASGRVLEKCGFVPTGDVVRHYSAGRGAEAPARTWRIDLGESGSDEPGPMRLAA